MPEHCASLIAICAISVVRASIFASARTDKLHKVTFVNTLPFWAVLFMSDLFLSAQMTVLSLPCNSRSHHCSSHSGLVSLQSSCRHRIWLGGWAPRGSRSSGSRRRKASIHSKFRIFRMDLGIFSPLRMLLRMRLKKTKRNHPGIEPEIRPIRSMECCHCATNDFP